MSYPDRALAEHTVPQAIVWPAHAEPRASMPAQYGPAQHYVAAPPQYPVAPPFYGFPAQGNGSPRRPGTVTAASVLAFIVGGLGALGCVLLLLAILVAAATMPHPVLVAILGAVLLVAVAHSALFIWGGVRALKGRKTMLMVMSIIQVAFTAFGLVSDLTLRSTAPGAAVVQAVAGLIFVVPILILLAQRSSREFSRARRAVTT
jgi:hypothetical protein